jgi:pilus assembly protein CpaB
MAKKKLLFAAFVVGSLAALLLFLYANQVEQEKQELIGVQKEVVKAARDIPAGTPLSKDLITVESVPERFLPPNYIDKKEADIYLGTPLAVKVKEGSMILASDFSVSEVSRDLSSKIPLGERALSMPVDAVTGVSGLMRPGDRVDILATFPISTKNELIPTADAADGEVGYVTMTLLQDVTLLATGQQISEVSTGANDEEKKRAKSNYNTVTLSVSVDEAELITIAQTRGKFMLLLRNRDDVDVAEVTKRTLKEVLTELEVIQEARAERIKVRRKKKKKDPGIIINSGTGQ